MKNRFYPLGLLVLAGLVGCAKQPAEAPAPPAPKVGGEKISFPPNAPQLAYLAMQAAQPRRLAITHLTGRLYLADDATVRVFTPVAGQVSAVKVDTGQSVAAGAPLAEINSPDYNQARADARSAAANLSVAEKAFARSKDLLEHGAAAAKDVDAAQAAWAAAAAERDRAAARLKLYHGDGTAGDPVYVLRSPIDGMVVERNLNPGQEVRADQMLANATTLFAPLFVVSDTSKLWLQIDAAETDLANLQSGEAIRVVAKAFPGKVFEGTIANIGSTLDPATRAIRVRGVVDNPSRLLKAEMYVLVDVVLDESKLAGAGVEIPSRAVFTLDRKSCVFVEVGPGVFERRRVEVGAEKDGRVPVSQGVAANERVVADGALLLEAILDPAD